MKLPKGFLVAGHSAGVKKRPNSRDLALIVSEVDAATVGMFTTNKVCAAPVQVCRQRLPAPNIRAVVMNSGNANACTGQQGLADARAMTRDVAERLGTTADQVLVCSTGVIGRPMPMDKILPALEPLCGKRAADETAFVDAALGILTTDTRIKTAHRTLTKDGKEVQIVGFAKGAAMIGPNMATMLAFIMTDARASTAELQPILQAAVDRSFHSISVEGHTSTNDSVLLLANGAADVSASDLGKEFSDAVESLARELAIAIIDDGEEATHRLTIEVRGTRTVEEAQRIAKTVADSALVKTAAFGNDPNWGRICSAAGYAGVDFDESQLSLRVNDTLLYDRGTPTGFDSKTESERMKNQREIRIELIFALGEAAWTFWSTDLSTGYVRFNAEYTT